MEIALPILSLIAFLFFCCYLPVRLLVHDRELSPNIGEFILYLTFGLCCVSLCSLVLLRIGISNMWWLLLPGGTSLVVVYRRPSLGKLNLASSQLSGESFFSLVVFIFYSHLILWQAIIIGRGAFPEYFFGVDTPYYLGQVHALLKATSYPPPSLSNLNVSVPYHYGVQNMAAVVTKVTTIPAHKSLCWITLPLILGSTWAALAKLKDRLQLTTLPSWIVYSLVLFGPFLGVKYWQMLLHGNYSLFLANFANPQLFQQHFPMFSTQMAVVLTFLILQCMVSFKSPKERLLYCLSLVLLSIVKSPWFVGVGCGIALYALARCLFRDFLCATYSAAALATVVLLNLFVSTSGTLALGLSPGYSMMTLADPRAVQTYPFAFNLFLFLKGVAKFLICWSIPFVSILTLMFLAGKKAYCRLQSLLPVTCLIIGPLLFINIFVLLDFKHPGVTLLNSNITQVADVIKYAVGICLAIPANILVESRNRVAKIVAYATVVVFLCLPFLHQAYLSALFARDHSTGHDFADNRPIANALQCIPVTGSIVVTNDFRYPADNYRRKDRQLQLPALFGHQCYACNFRYEFNGSSEERLEEQHLLSRKTWNAGLTSLIATRGWTHLLIHKEYPFPKEIPFTQIYSDSRYAVYDLRKKVITSSASSHDRHNPHERP